MMTTRRSFVAGLSAATLWPLGGLLSGSEAQARISYLFLNGREARLLEALCARLLAEEGSGIGEASRDATVGGVCEERVVYYIDRQLASAWGTGAQAYRSGPWQPGALPALGHAITPADSFRIAMTAIDHDCFDQQASFAAQSLAAQDGFLHALAENRIDLRGVASAQFFNLLLQLAVEGYFTLVGTDRDRLRWRMIGFPGAFASAL